MSNIVNIILLKVCKSFADIIADNSLRFFLRIHQVFITMVICICYSLVDSYSKLYGTTLIGNNRTIYLFIYIDIYIYNPLYFLDAKKSIY